MNLYLVRAARPPRGTYGRVEVGRPEVYAFVKDQALFLAWAQENLTVADCGHPSAAAVKVVTDRAVKEFQEHAVLPPPGIQIQQEPEVPLVVTAMGVHAGAWEDEFTWRSPAKVVRDDRKKRAGRRARWAR